MWSVGSNRLTEIIKTSVTSKNRFTQESGFTLLELLVVIFLMMLVTSVAVVRLQGAGEGPALKAESRKLVALMRHLRGQAIGDGVVQSIAPLIEKDQPQENQQLVIANGYRILPAQTVVRLPAGITFQIMIEESLDPMNSIRDLLSFYPDGSADSGTVQLRSTAGEVTIVVNWLTGEVAIADIPDDDQT